MPGPSQLQGAAMNAAKSIKVTVWLPEGAETWSWQVVLADRARRIRTSGVAATRRLALAQAFQTIDLVGDEEATVES